MLRKLSILVVFGLAVGIAGPASGQTGIGVSFAGNVVGEGLAPTITVPITVSDGLIFEPSLFLADIENAGSDILLAATLEKHTNPGGPTSLFGGGVGINLQDPEFGDSRTDISLAGFVGGSAPLAEAVSIVGRVGLDILLIGDDGPTTISTAAALTIRWWVFGS